MRVKVFIALLVSVVLAVVATSIAARFAFLSGFLGYLNHQEMARVRRMLPELVVEYDKHGDWEFLREDPRAWIHVAAGVDFGHDRRHDRPSGWPQPPARNLPPLLFAPTADTPSLGMRLALLDSTGHWVIGNPAAGKDSLLQEIAVDGKLVGWIAVLPFNRVTAGAADAFQHQQLVSSWIIGVAAVGLAAVVSIILTGRILRPIRSFGAATHRLAAGDYATRMEVNSPDEIGRLATDFNRMALTLQKNEELRRTLVADVSHELRTPVAILRAELEALGDKVRDLSPEGLKSLQNEVTLLGKLITDLHELSLADVGALAYRMSRVDVADVLRSRLAAFQDRFAQQAITIEASIPERALSIDADEIRIQQLLNNLLENSLRYTDRGGCLRVLCQAQSDAVVIDLQDSTPGVPEELLPRLFERFYRVDASRSRASGGSGLGLAIVRSVVEAHAGDIRAAGSPLGGLWVRITLPLAR